MKLRLSRRMRIVVAAVGAFVLVLVVARICLPYVLLPRINAYLADFSPDYSLHIDRLHLSVLRMAYRFEDAKGRFKKDDRVFLEVRRVDVSIAWRELLHGRVLTDVVVDIKVVSWADEEYPSVSAQRLSAAQRSLADRRGDEIKKFLRGLDGDVKVDTYSMAERAGRVATLLGTTDARVKKSLEVARIDTTDPETRAVPEASRAIVLFIVKG